MENKKILDVEKVGFLRDIQENRAPESFSFPACMCSLMRCLNEPYPIKTIFAHNREYTLRTGYLDFLAATGMAFGLLWADPPCPSEMDLTQVHDHDVTIGYAFEWAGYSYEILPKDKTDDTLMKKAVVSSIDRGVPVLAFGLIGPPECSIICGYDQGGEVWIGWSHFQTMEQCPTEKNGMFRTKANPDTLWKIVLTSRKTSRKGTLTDLYQRAVRIMQTTETEGYLAGTAAYDAWMAYVADRSVNDADDQMWKRRHGRHHHLVGNHAEARCFAAMFMREKMCEKSISPLVSAADHFLQIHDLCWQIWGVLGGLHANDAHLAFKDDHHRKKIVEYIREMKNEDEKARRSLQAAVKVMMSD